MKIFKVTFIALLVLFEIFGTAIAQDKNETKREVAGLGVALLPAPLTTTRALNIEDGVGMAITGLAPKSALTNKLQKGDILYMFNDQYIVNIEQLQTLLNMYKPGDKAQITAFIKDKKETFEIVLIERPFIPIHRDPFKFELPQIEIKPFNFDDINEIMSQLNHLKRKRIATSKSPAGNSHVNISVTSNITTIEMDDTHQFRLSGHNKNMQFTVKEINSGKEIFSGPVNTEEEIQKIPEEYRQRAQKMLKSVVSSKLNEILPTGSMPRIDQILDIQIPQHHIDEAVKSINQIRELIKTFEEMGKPAKNNLKK